MTTEISVMYGSEKVKKLQSLFFLIIMIFWVRIKWKSILTDKMHESVICDIWAYTNTSIALLHNLLGGGVNVNDNDD